MAPRGPPSRLGKQLNGGITMKTKSNVKAGNAYGNASQYVNDLKR
jgi:hypothetical protein